MPESNKWLKVVIPSLLRAILTGIDENSVDKSNSDVVIPSLLRAILTHVPLCRNYIFKGESRNPFSSQGYSDFVRQLSLARKALGRNPFSSQGYSDLDKWMNR